MRKTGLTLLVFLFAGSLSLSALDHFMMELGSGLMWLHNEAYDVEGPGAKDPDPITFRLDLNFPLYFTENLYLNPGLGISGNWWQYVEAEDWAMPVDQMFRDLYVLSLDFDVPVGFQLNFKSLSMALFAGPSFRIRIPLWGEKPELRDKMASYFLSKGRFFNVMGGLAFVFPLSERFAFTLRGESSVPIHNLWSSGGLPFSDGLTVSASVGARFIW